MGNNLIDLYTIIYAAVDWAVNTDGEVLAIGKTTDKYKYEKSELYEEMHALYMRDYVSNNI